MKRAEKNDEKATVSYLLHMAEGRQKVLLAIAVLCSVLSGLLTFVPYIMIFRVIMFVFDESGGLELAMQYGVTAMIAIVLRFIFQAISMMLTHMGAYELLYLVRKRLCQHIGEIELGFFNDKSTGEIKKILMEDVERLESFFAHQIPDITVALVVPVIAWMYMFSIHRGMALLLLVPIVITLVVQMLELVIANPVMEDYSVILGRCNSGIMQYINGMSVMKAYNLTADSYESYASAIADYNALWKRFSKILAPMSAVSKVVIESGVFFTLPFGGYLYLEGKLTLGSYLFFMIISIVFLASYNNLLNFAQIFSQISAGLEHVKSIMDIPAVKGGEKILSATESHKLVFEDVSFAYGEQEVLRNVNIALEKGSLNAFVGVSGAGKTTAAQLIPRFWNVTKGSIKIDGIDIKQIQTENLMDLISFVFQENFMVNDTIYQNIAIGKPGCTKEEVESAAKAAQIHEFIQSLPNGYETNIGETGIKMSGGEKQRVCIARAILKNAPIIIFDEATSFTDAENEYKIQMALGELLKGKTTIMIAHRLHTIVSADQICVFEEGSIKEKGTHEELLHAGGLYKKMWNTYTDRREADV